MKIRMNQNGVHYRSGEIVAAPLPVAGELVRSGDAEMVDQNIRCEKCWVEPTENPPSCLFRTDFNRTFGVE